jgi:hypothetical protein
LDLADSKSPFSGDMEPGVLIALILAASAGAWKAGRRTAANARKGEADARIRKLDNLLEASEYDRLHFANDPERLLAQVERPLRESDVVNAMISRKSCSEAVKALARGGVRHEAGAKWDAVKALFGAGTETLGVGADVGGAVAKATPGAIEGAKTGAKLAYPTLVLALLAGAYAAGKSFADRRDPSRRRRKALKEVMTSEMLDNRTPTILSVGSELPWEKSKWGAPPHDKDAEIPHAATKAAIADNREIRI